jgi:hypothetical protein
MTMTLHPRITMEKRKMDPYALYSVLVNKSVPFSGYFSDKRSARAARILAHAGLGDVQVIGGGMTAWLENGWPVVGVNSRAT